MSTHSSGMILLNQAIHDRIDPSHLKELEDFVASEDFKVTQRMLGVYEETVCILVPISANNGASYRMDSSGFKKVTRCDELPDQIEEVTPKKLCRAFKNTCFAIGETPTSRIRRALDDFARQQING
jgi:hypothetical protein